MHDENKQLWLKLPAFIMAIFSLIGASYVCISAYMLRRVRQKSNSKRQNLTKPFVITHCVFAMSFCDIMINIWILLVWAPPIFDKIEYYPQNTCKIIGAFGQFFMVTSSCFYSVIVYITWIMVTAVYSIIVNGQNNILSSIPISNRNSNESNTPYHILLDNDNDRNNKNNKKSGSNDTYSDVSKNILTNKLNKIVFRGAIFSMIMAIILTSIPFIGDSYGYVDNVSNKEGDNFECWIIDHYYQLCLYIPISFYMLFALILTTYSICRVRKIAKVKSNKDFNKTKKGLLVRRLLSFTIIFIITWIFPLIVRLWPILIKNSNPPFILLILHHTSLGFIGLGNSIVWITSSSFQSFNKSIKNMKYNNNKKKIYDIDCINDRRISNENDYIKKNGSGSSNDSNYNESKTYKLDRAAIKKLNRHKKSFKKLDENKNKNNRKSGSESEQLIISKSQKKNSDIQMSQVPSIININNDEHERKVSVMSDGFDDDDDDDIEFSINSQSKFSISNTDDIFG